MYIQKETINVLSVMHSECTIKLTHLNRINRMLHRLFSVARQGAWSAIAMLIIVAVAGPEVLISLELMALAEMVGASTFVMAYVSGFMLYVSPCLKKLVDFERHSDWFYPSWTALKTMPSLVIHCLPERLTALSFMGMVLSATVVLCWQQLMQ